jgi:microcystin-dependent protein
MVHTFAFAVCPTDTEEMFPRRYLIDGNRALFDVLGYRYSNGFEGDFFWLPIGLPIYTMTGVPLQQCIAVNGISPLRTFSAEAVARVSADDRPFVPYIGEVRTFPYNFCPYPFLPTDGRALNPIREPQYEQLEEVLDRRYGDDGSFARLSRLPIGSPVYTMTGVPLQQCIAFAGFMPPHVARAAVDGVSGSSSHLSQTSFVGEVRTFALESCPDSYLPMLGQLLPIPQNIRLWSVLSNRFGGDGRRNFALPIARPVFAANGPLMPCIAVEGPFPGRQP